MSNVAVQRKSELIGESDEVTRISAWENFRNTKTYDLLTASPLMVWYWLGLHAQLPLILRRVSELGTGSIDLKGSLQLAAIAGSAAFNVVAIYFLAVRLQPLARSKGVLPRVTAFAGAFFGTSVFFLPVAQLTLALQAISNILIFCGSAGALFVIVRLGRSFTMLPEARRLDTGGPYAIVRHPLYVCETIAFLGLALQFQQPWSLLIVLVGSVFMGARAAFEERVLEAQFPQYAEYRTCTSRFVPHVY